MDNTLNTTVDTFTSWRDYYELTKPRVVMLIVFTAVVGMFLSVPGWPGIEALLFGTLGIGLASSSAAVYNHVLDARIDIQMMRTRGRPLPQGKLTETSALAFATILCIISMLILTLLVNPLTAILTFVSLIGYAVVYTAWLKRAPMLGWKSVTNEVQAGALLLFLIVFVWTPPHFWALAIARKEEYARVDIPMLPVTHGDAYTRLNILLYTILLLLVTVLPYLIGMSGLIYLAAAVGLGGRFLWYAVRMYREPARQELPMQMFRFSITYLMILFAALLVDHYAFFQLSL